MAVPTRTETLDDLYTTTLNNRRAGVIDQLFERTTLLNELRAASKITFDGTGGRYLEVNLSYAKNQTVTSLGRGDTISIDDTKFLTVAQFEWKFVAGSIVRYFVDDAKNKSKEAHINLANSKIDNLRDSMADDLEIMLNADGTGNGSLDTEGLQNLVDATPNTARTVGNIAQTTYTWWKNKQKASSGAASVYLRSDLRNLSNTCSLGSKASAPNLYYTSQTVHELIEDEVDDSRLVYNKDKNIDLLTSDPLILGRRVVWSPQAPAGNIYVLNTEYIGLTIDPDINFQATEWKSIPNQLDRVMQVVVKMNLVTTRRASLGVLTAVAA